jgi:hypothetical protein
MPFWHHDPRQTIGPPGSHNGADFAMYFFGGSYALTPTEKKESTSVLIDCVFSLLKARRNVFPAFAISTDSSDVLDQRWFQPL